MNLHHAVGTPPNAARYMWRSARAAVATQSTEMHFHGRVAADESHVRSKKCNKYEGYWLRWAGGTLGRATVVDAAGLNTNEIGNHGATPLDTSTLRGFVVEHATWTASLFADEAVGEERMFNRAGVRLSVGGYVNGHLRTGSVESYWSMLNMARGNDFRKFSPKQPPLYTDWFAGRPDISEFDTMVQLEIKVVGPVGHFLYLAGTVCHEGSSV